MKKKNGGPPRRILKNGRMLTKPREIGDAQNEYYYKKIENIREECTGIEDDPLRHLRECLSSWDRRPGQEDKLHLKEVTEDEVKKIILKMKTSRTEGLDSLCSEVIKGATTELLSPITYNCQSIYKNIDVSVTLENK